MSCEIPPVLRRAKSISQRRVALPCISLHWRIPWAQEADEDHHPGRTSVPGAAKPPGGSRQWSIVLGNGNKLGRKQPPGRERDEKADKKRKMNKKTFFLIFQRWQRWRRKKSYGSKFRRDVYVVFFTCLVLTQRAGAHHISRALRRTKGVPHPTEKTVFFFNFALSFARASAL